MARSTMTKLISRFRLFRGDISSSVITDGQVENLFDLNRSYIDKVILSHDSDAKVFESPGKYVESGFTLIDSGDNIVTADASSPVEGLFSFNSAQSTPLRLKGYSHNLFLTLALAYRAIVSNDDQWQRYERGEVELEKKDVLKLADNFERMGFRPQTIRTVRG